MTKLFAVLTACAVVGAAYAQPSATDLGTLTNPQTINLSGITINAGDIIWYTLTIPAVSTPVYLDIDSEGSALAPSNDTEIGLYTSIGDLVASDDDDGDSLRSQLTFGAGFPARPAVGAGLAYDGRDGNLAAGTYYLCIAGFNTTFGTSGWGVTSASANVGSGNLNIVLNNNPPPPPGTYVENGDAGDLPGTAQQATGSGSLTTIIGTFGANDIDMYEIDICDSASFSATTVGGATVDTQLFLFDTTGLGVTFDDDSAGVLQSTITSQFLAGSGRYLLAITRYNLDPIDASAQLLWINTPFDVERAPDGPGAANPVASWTGTTVSGSYSITLTGACFIPGGTPCVADFNGDRVVNESDLGLLLQAWQHGAGGDADGDGDTDESDLGLLLQNWLHVCP
ncbi:MAG: DVUA0089 family protein [Phycisphaerae bacterium]